MYSFDIFDTLITRSTAVPKGIFMIMQNILIKDREIYGVDENFAESFYFQRTGSEELARINWCISGVEEIELDQIYDAMVSCGAVDREQAEKIKKLELCVEYNNILPIYENISKLKKRLASGERVILISDMYLSAQEIRNLLCKVDLVFKTIPIYVSSEFKKTKGSGRLYREIAKLENVAFKEWTHYGDNISADVKMPISLGINAIQILVKEPREYEKILLNRYSNDAFVQSAVGIAEYLNMQCGGQEYERIGNSYGGSIIYSYVEWILKTSLEQGIKRLYFIARDGWILKQVADIIIANRKLQIKTYYLYGSRRAWRLSSIYEDTGSFEKILTKSGKVIRKASDIAGLLQISKEELAGLLPDQFKCLLTESEKIFPYFYDYIIQYLIQEPALKELLLKKHEKKRDMVLEYLDQNIDLSDENFAFVELSGTGYTQVCLANIVNQIKQYNVKSFFMQIDEVWCNKNSSFYVFFPNAIPNHYIVELLCRAPHGQTEGYKKENGKVVPILEGKEGEAIIKAGYLDYVKGVLKYAELLELTNYRNHISGNVNLVSSYLEYAEKNIETEVQHFFENMPFSSADAQKGQTFAPPLTRRQIRTMFFWGEVPKDYKGASLTFALSHISKRNIKIRDFYVWLSNTNVGGWCVRQRFNFMNGLHGTQTYYYPKGFLEGKTVLYAAGKVGKDYYQQIQKDKKLELIAWSDSNYCNMQEDEKKLLIPPDEIVCYDFDFILVAIADMGRYCEIQKDLMGIGIDRKQIVWVCPLVRRQKSKF